jgi:hypothetical protein
MPGMKAYGEIGIILHRDKNEPDEAEGEESLGRDVWQNH